MAKNKKYGDVLREARARQNGLIFGKFPKGEGGVCVVISDLKNFIAFFFGLETATLVMNFQNKNF